MSHAFDDTLDLLFAGGMQQLDDAMKARGVSPETRRQIAILSRSMFEFVPYAIAQKKRPDDVALFLKFARSKGLLHAQMFGNESLDCGIAVVGFLKTAASAYAGVSSSGPFPVPAALLAFGLLMLDLLEVGNRCPIVQQAYYEGFLRTSRGETRSAKRLVDGRYGTAPGASSSSAKLPRP